MVGYDVVHGGCTWPWVLIVGVVPRRRSAECRQSVVLEVDRDRESFATIWNMGGARSYDAASSMCCIAFIKQSKIEDKKNDKCKASLTGLGKYNKLKM
ncbi:unnamed protein product [Prunus armeniaca]|uniref:Uncharacterized protein n=1 Tax=Prunus armeniaca TaxID=36596 RepID=A0A6J5VZP3_PRUAR|nr:unnamed protein product [Prunus armeniaca]